LNRLKLACLPVIAALLAVTVLGCATNATNATTASPTASSSPIQSGLPQSTSSITPVIPAGSPGGTWALTQLSDSPANKFGPSVDGNYVVWFSLDERTHHQQIYLYDMTTGKTRQVTDGQADNMYVQVSGGRILWQSSTTTNPSTDLVLYDIASGSTKTISKDVNLDAQGAQYPAFAGDLVVWQNENVRSSATTEIDLYDVRTGKTEVLTPHGRLPSTDGRYVAWVEPAGKASTLVLYDASTGKTQTLPKTYNVTGAPNVGDGFVVWSASDGQRSTVYLYDIASQVTKPLSSSSASLSFPETNGGLVVWRQQLTSAGTAQPFGEAAPGTSIVLYDPKTGRTTQVSDNVLPGTQPEVRDGLVMWEGVVDHVKAVFVYDTGAKDTFQLPKTKDIINERQMSTSGGHVVWAGWTTGRYEIFLVTRPH